MRSRTLFIAAGFTLATTIVLAAEFAMRPGRWEVTTYMDFGDKQLPGELPLAEPMKAVSCLTAQDIERDLPLLQNPMSQLDKSCKMSNYRETGAEIRYTVTCDDAQFDYRFTMHSPDSFSSVADSHGKDPSQKLIIKTSGKRTAAACSDAELAQDARERREAESEGE